MWELKNKPKVTKLFFENGSGKFKIKKRFNNNKININNLKNICSYLEVRMSVLKLL